eukprot:2698644-Pyramimonas_sp.AAC.1
MTCPHPSPFPHLNVRQFVRLRALRAPDVSSHCLHSGGHVRLTRTVEKCRAHPVLPLLLACMI